ncbi:CRISPR-associated endonuclease Cas2 [Actinotignum urinale]|uniref:CRISPR-associated endoribonuclease Cas2 n=1 Tax=Actinotignum urinale TaxID=190146 RepID=A0ABU5GAS2_9ACTO|nr:CRISPR-associated endonuclease Cas2 [Actinotignum urinale]MDY5133765.1 CRISPR-associated endonuclease Cas2 [Actinotignum urinale]MDY5152350.1 CRISPR-associated endonuclease Cas2 [Actinotignum urinale]WIK59322.1 CRISPR-associated endonuclease Cas2 [Actinotignum urinale]
MAEDPMWCLVMFDLPTETTQNKRDYRAFRNLLIDSGFLLTQYSVYTKYSPRGYLTQQSINFIKDSVPPQGEVCILHVTDRQWANMIRFFNAKEKKNPEQPEQLTIF